ncbi:MAG TPA: TonB-dependent receptor, partial [Vicinamibacteria bacterium]|nr:TonB-dependent receptor [Vicinamibacteria bacterium]
MQNPRSAVVISLLALAMGGLASPVHAQGVTATISGTVVDPGGDPVPDASVTLISERTADARKATTGTTGTFTFPALLPGPYTLRVERQGFSKYERSGNVVAANDHLSLGRIALALGEITEVVTVASEGTAVELGAAERSSLLSAKQLELLAVRGRDVMSMLKVLPGVTASEAFTEQDSLGGSFGSRVPNIQGARESFSTITVDGLAGNDMGTPAVFSSSINLEAIGEVKVQFNNYRAESGRTGGATVSIVTKSGTQEFHGTVYGYKRHESFNANDTFNNRNNRPRPLYRHTNAGLAVGGPLYLPGVFNKGKDKAFFFYSFEHLDTLTPQPIRQVTMPTELERRGDFSQTVDVSGRLIVIRDPITGLPFPGNVIPADRINPNGRALLNRFPLPNALGRSATFNHLFQESLDVPKKNHVLRLDFRPTEKDSFYVRGSYWKSDQGGKEGGYSVAAAAPGDRANWGLVPMTYVFEDTSLVGHYTRILSSSLVTEFTGGWRRGSEDHLVTDDALDSVRRSTIGFTLGQFFPAANPLGIMPAAQFGGVPSNDARFNYDGRFPLFGDDTIWSVSNDTTWLRGSHTFKGGLYFERSHNVEGLTAESFGGRFLFDRDAQNPLDTGHAYSNALLGVFREYRESSSRPPTDGYSTIVEGYLQDTWKASRRLTLDYGLRLAWYTHWRQGDGQAASFSLERYDRARAPRLFEPVVVNGVRQARNPITGQILPAIFIGAFVPGSGDPFNGMVQETDESYPDGFKDQEPLLVEPRFGFTYDLTGDQKTALRGGFGVFHNVRAAGGTLRTLTQQPPVQLNPSIFYGTMDTYLQTSGVTFPSSVNGWVKDVRTPVLYNFSVGVQRDVGFGTVIDVAYVASLQRNLEQTRNINRVAPGARFLAANTDPTRPGQALPDNFFRPYPGYGNITLRDNDGVANYHSLQVTANRRFTRGLQFGLAYTYSRAEGTANTDGGEVAAYMDPMERDYDFLNYDQTHVFVVNYTWDIPRASRLWNHAAVRVLFDNWQVSGITTFASGFVRPFGTFTTVDGADITGGGDNGRVNLTGDPGADVPEGFAFNPAVVARPARGDFGNASR